MRRGHIAGGRCAPRKACYRTTICLVTAGRAGEKRLEDLGAVPPGVAALLGRRAKTRLIIGNRGARVQERAECLVAVPPGVAPLLGELAAQVR